MSTTPDKSRVTDAPAEIDTPHRPGQSGAQEQKRPGPSPLSPNPTGPHAPYEPDDPEGFAAGKHVKGQRKP